MPNYQKAAGLQRPEWVALRQLRLAHSDAGVNATILALRPAPLSSGVSRK
jgi:hypothetical protein